MASNDIKYVHVMNIIKRAQSLTLNIGILGADTREAKRQLQEASLALKDRDYEKALTHAKESIAEVMRLKTAMEGSGAQPSATTPTAIRTSAAGQPMAPGPPSRTTHQSPSTPPSPPQVNVPPATPSPTTVPEKKKPSLIDTIELREGYSYLIEEPKADTCFRIFIYKIPRDFTRLCISRTNPKQLKDKYNLDDVSLFWLTDRMSDSEQTISPSLESLMFEVEDFMDKNEKSAMLLDGIEYLISNNNFNSVLSFIRRVIDKTSETNTILLLSLSPFTIDDKEIKILEAEMEFYQV